MIKFDPAVAALIVSLGFNVSLGCLDSYNNAEISVEKFKHVRDLVVEGKTNVIAATVTAMLGDQRISNREYETIIKASKM